MTFHLNERVEFSLNDFIFPQEVVKMIFYHYVWLGIYSVWFMTIDTYSEVVKKMNFLLVDLLLEMYLLLDRQCPW